ncbi:MAG TPA: hypothetical protein VGF94_25005 [Kofleriaceae bacterium]
MRALLATILLAACGSAGLGELRFANTNPARRVDDRHDIAKPTTRVFARTLYMLDVFFANKVDELFALPDTHRAGDVNAVDEVPDSTWFQNRIGERELGVDEIRSAGRGDHPEPTGPWTVVGTKVGGASPGLLVRDASGAKFVMKFDTRGEPDMQTGADVVAQKLLWAAGYNTPEDAIVTLRREDLKLAPTARVEDVFGNKRAMTEHDLAEVLTQIDHRKDGSYRALVSRYLDGVPVGGYAADGLRADDPNDRVAHEDRRTLRGQRVLFAWLDNTDVKEDNGLDMWIADGAGHYLLHHILDFGLALGVYGYDQVDSADGFAETLDYRVQAASLVTLGLWRRPWEGIDVPAIRGVGRFESAHFDPLGWHDRYPYAPFRHVQSADGFWAAKIVMRFTEAQIRAAAEQGAYEDPRAVDYITRTLVERQRITGRAWFARVSPLDHIAIDAGARISFDDLARVYFRDTPATTYVADAYDYRGQPLAWHADTASTTLPPLSLPADHDGYTIVEVHAVRAGHALPAVRIHIARDPQAHAPRVIGIRRS